MSNEIMKHNEYGKAMPAIYSSVNAATLEERLAVFQAVSNSGSLDDIIGETLAVRDVIIQPVMVKSEEGEREAARIVLIDKAGAAYGCVSTGVETSLRNLFAIVGEPPYSPALIFKVVKKQGRHGYKFTSLEFVSVDKD